MENLDTTQNNYKLSFHGKGSDLFGIIIVNWLLTIVTLGIYYPWAKAKQLKFFYGATALKDDFFTFHGTGNEMFKGFIKSILIFTVLFSIFYIFSYFELQITGLILLYLGFFALIPIAVHGSYRYRMSRTSWRGIRFGYRGNKYELLKKYFTWVLLSLLTMGIYGAWMAVNLRNYVLSHIKFGDIDFESNAEGSDYLWLNIKGYFLTIFTLGIYSFWWQKDLFNFYVDNISLHKEDKTIYMHSTATGGGFFKLMIVNLFIVVFTLGFGYAWAATRTMNYITSSIQLEGDIDLDAIVQSEENFNDATGDEISDFLDIDFIV